jgi:penicillin amidase
MRFVRPALSGLVLLALLWLGFFGAGPVPPVGLVLDPWRGVWAAAASADLPPQPLAAIPGLMDTVRVVYDDRAVPHIFARSETDAYRALGYVVARDRLFQLEMQTRASAGTLSEVLGRPVLEADRMQRALGLAWSAEREWAAVDTASAVARAARAYADGVNAWIDHLTPRDVPLEYHLLRSRPQRWKPQYTLYLMKRMGYTLAFSTEERQRDRLAAMIGDSAVSALFPVHAPIQEPIQPGPGPYPRYDVRRLPPPSQPPPSVALHRLPPLEVASGEAGEDAVGSNNWAVSPRRSATGHALLAGDPHLDLTLPSIWYEVHLSAGEGLDVYGVTIPGVPSVVIGFNRDIAWSFTNTGSDVLDLYAETLNHRTHPTAYRLDGSWRPLDLRIERYLGTRGEVLAVDTIYHTHRGPVSFAGSQPTSMRWLVLEAGSTEALLQAQKAHSVDQWLRAMESFRTPAQNGVVADRSGTIAIRSTGAFPLRPGDGRGDRLRDGTTSRSDWTGYWPLTRYPFSRNPSQGYLVSANQEPKDPRVDPGYLGSDWPPPWRAIRINQLLAADSQVTVDAMRRLQTDPGSARADAVVPLLIQIGRAAEAAGTADTAALRQALDLLAQWDRRYTRDDAGAVLFEFTVQELQNRLWDELLAHSPMALRRVATPGDAVLLEALRDSLTPWWDDRRTAGAVEGRDDVVAASLTAALARARQALGDPARWRWDRVQHANIYHLLQLPSLSALDLPVQGGPSTISPSSGNGRHGPSWRMVVELGPEVRGFGIYPGGQSGNPASARYLDRLPRWLSGQLDTLRFPRSADEFPAGQTPARLTLTGTGER